MVTIPTAPLAAHVQGQSHRGTEMNSVRGTARRECCCSVVRAATTLLL